MQTDDDGGGLETDVEDAGTYNEMEVGGGLTLYVDVASTYGGGGGGGKVTSP